MMNEYQSDSSREIFREFFAQTASTVFVITTLGDLGGYGVTMTSVTPVTDQSPVVLFCVNRRSRIHDILLKHQVLCINILNAKQSSVANHFAGLTGIHFEERLSKDVYDESLHLKQPRIKEAIAYLDGRVIEDKNIGTHTVFFVGIEDIEIRSPTNDVLTYFRRDYHLISSINKN